MDQTLKLNKEEALEISLLLQSQIKRIERRIEKASPKDAPAFYQDHINNLNSELESAKALKARVDVFLRYIA